MAGAERCCGGRPRSGAGAVAPVPVRGCGSELSRCGCLGAGEAAGAGGALGASAVRAPGCRGLGRYPRGKGGAGPGLSAGLRSAAVLASPPAAFGGILSSLLASSGRVSFSPAGPFGGHEGAAALRLQGKL